ncbi:MAG: transketolase [Oscillospiraceae bacterium]|jgi:transketolase|nr:transketolase [Oscillospiraceae bacterium]
MNTTELRQFAAEIRTAALECLESFGSGHIGGSMSIVEALAVLYGGALRHDPQNPNWQERDRLVLSKGHAGPALYAALALRGFFPREMLLTLNQGGTHLPSHVDRTKTPGVDMTCGSLGQGISAAIGMALGSRLNGWNNKTYLILGDGECDEGQVWEGAMFAAHYKLSSLICFVDYNKQQLGGFLENVLDLGDIAAKFRSFSWNVIEAPGHDVAAIAGAVAAAGAQTRRPTAIILDTIKGYGVDFAQGVEFNHSMSFTKEQIGAAIAAIRSGI